MTEPTQAEILSNLMYYYPRYMHLKMYIDKNDNMALEKREELYKEAVKKHNAKLMNNCFIDAGFDLFLPFNILYNISTKGHTIKVDHKVKCAARIVSVYPNGDTRSVNTGYYMHPRSSIYKTPLRLANSAGVIDAGYRGNLIAMFDVIREDDTEPFTIDLGSRLVQLCAPDLVPIYVELVDSVEELGEKTTRAEGGFGSTGR
jgi:dUTP pyrophosphatase